MAKTQAPYKILIPAIGTFITNAVPDPFDERDLEYRPRLQPLAREIDQRDDPLKENFMREQQGSSCTGHAVATVINIVRARMARDLQAQASGSLTEAEQEYVAHLQQPVSPYMLYYFARRYDEYEGEEDQGSSLRAAFKGWFHQGVALEADWPHPELAPKVDLEGQDFVRKCRQQPLGAFYRVNPFRLDDMQSAINELRAIAVSAAIHDGWTNLALMTRGSQTMHVIARPVDAQALGGHAFALVGYNEVGFLVQNSWGPNWGRGGFATLPYEDWLEHAYDAWVARPGVPQTPFYAGHTRTAPATNQELVTAPGPDLKRLQSHVINLGNNGRLSDRGKFRSTPQQIEKIFDNLERWHTFWSKGKPLPQKRHIVLYAHGGMVQESSGLEDANRHLNWWLNNEVYPIYFAWQSGPTETFLDQLADAVRVQLPAGGLGFDLVEQFDRLVEKKFAPTLRWLWEEMKENARAASGDIQEPEKVTWPPKPENMPAIANMPGASLAITRLAEYIQKYKDQASLHLVGHSAGAIFHAGLINCLAKANLPIASLTFLAPAIRLEEFKTTVLPHLTKEPTEKQPSIRFTLINLSETRELDDKIPEQGLAVYHKSALYLVSRGLERPDHQAADSIVSEHQFQPQGNAYEALLLGIAKHVMNDSALTDLLKKPDCRLILSPVSSDQPDRRSGAMGHAGFEDDPQTMTSVIMRILQTEIPLPQHNYQKNAALHTEIDLEGAPLIKEPMSTTADTSASGDRAQVETAEPQTQQPQAPPGGGPVVPEVAVAPRYGSPIIDILQSEGWTLSKPL
jgi:hypothetical protein